MLTYDQIFENNRNWAKKKKENQPEYFQKLSEGQQPRFLYIGCSDSRVNALEMMGAKPGEVFVHRNIANVVSPKDICSMSVLEFAVAILKVEHIVVCGHYHCGGIEAATQAPFNIVLNPWLQPLRDVYDLNRNELHAIRDEKQRLNRFAELNVLAQCREIYRSDVVQNALRLGEGPEVHGWVFDMNSGLLLDLDFDQDSGY